MMKKSLMAVLLSIIFALVLGTSGAFAAEAPMSKEVEKALEEIVKTNDKIYEEIEKAQLKSQELYDNKIDDLKKEKDAKKLVEIEAKYEEEITKLISKLDVKTQEITRKAVEKAGEAGVICEIEWIPVQFADRVAMIDPIKVIGW